MKFVGQGYLLEQSVYETKKDKNDPKSPLITKYKYVFLVGDKEGDQLFNAHVEQCISDAPLLKKDRGFMDVIDISVEIRSYPKKVGDTYVTEEKPVYAVVAEK